MSTIALRDYQADFDARLSAAYRNGARRVLGVLPTGGGKTVVFTHRAEQFDGRSAIVAHRRELIRQAHRKCLEHGVAASLYPSAEPARVTVGSIQTLARRLDQLPRFGQIVLDEAHHAVAGQHEKLLASQPDAIALGVTATPERLDGRGLGEVFEAMVVGPSVADLTAAGHLAPARVYGPPAPVDLAGVRTTAGDYNDADLERVMMKPSLLGSAPEHYEKLCPGVPAIVFCVNVKHAQESAAAFRAEGWRFVCVWGDMDPTARDRAFVDIAAGRIHGMTTCDLVSEGVDIPGIGCVIMQRPTQSLVNFMQWCGRAARPALGKTHYTLLDHAGNCRRHGFPDDPRDWSLDAPKRRAKTAAVAQCPTCYAIHRPAPRCPECGYSYECAAAEAEARRIEQLAGELALLTPADLRLRELRETPLLELRRKARTFSDLEEIQRARGLHHQWPEVNARFLVGPRVSSDGREFA